MTGQERLAFQQDSQCTLLHGEGSAVRLCTAGSIILSPVVPQGTSMQHSIVQQRDT